LRKFPENEGLDCTNGNNNTESRFPNQGFSINFDICNVFIPIYKIVRSALHHHRAATGQAVNQYNLFSLV